MTENLYRLMGLVYHVMIIKDHKEIVDNVDQIIVSILLNFKLMVLVKILKNVIEMNIDQEMGLVINVQIT